MSLAAAKGIGFGIASAFAEQGPSLFITGRTEGRLTEAAEKLKGEYGVDVAYTVAEGSDEAQVEAAIAKCVEHFGKLDVMVNKRSGFQSGTNLIDHTKEDFDLAINTGLYGTFFYMKHAFPELKRLRRLRHQPGKRRRPVQQARPVELCGSQGRHSRHDARCGHRVGPRRRARELHLPAGDDRAARSMEGKPTHTFAATIKGIPAGTFRRPENRHRRRSRVPRERFVGRTFLAKPSPSRAAAACARKSLAKARCTAATALMTTGARNRSRRSHEQQATCPSPATQADIRPGFQRRKRPSFIKAKHECASPFSSEMFKMSLECGIFRDLDGRCDATFVAAQHNPR